MLAGKRSRCSRSTVLTQSFPPRLAWQILQVIPGVPRPTRREFVASAITNCSKKSPAAGWVWFIALGKPVSGASSR